MKLGELLTDKSKWCKGYYARDKGGNYVDETEPNAVRWCLKGANRKINRGDVVKLNEVESKIRDAIFKLFGTYLHIVWQDDPSTTWEMVKQVLIEAGEWPEEKGEI